MTSRSRFGFGALLLAVAIAACQGTPATESGAATVTLSVSPDGCSPKAVTAPAGQVLFVITNEASDPVEFEIIGSDKKVIDEAENIFPGFVVNLRSRLDGGTYELVCGSLTAPRGTLTVTGAG